MAYEDLKYFPRKTVSDKVLRDKTFNIAKNPKYNGYQRILALMVHKFFDKKSSSANTSGGAAKGENMSNQEVAKELHKPIIRKFEKLKVRSSFMDDILGADLPIMQLICKFNKGICLLLCLIDIFSKYAWVVPLKDKKGITITNAFQNLFGESSRKPDKTWVDKGNELYNRSMKSFMVSK